MSCLLLPKRVTSFESDRHELNRENPAETRPHVHLSVSIAFDVVHFINKQALIDVATSASAQSFGL